MSRSGAADAMSLPGFGQSLFCAKTHFFPGCWKWLGLSNKRERKWFQRTGAEDTKKEEVSFEGGLKRGGAKVAER